MKLNTVVKKIRKMFKNKNNVLFALIVIVIIILLYRLLRRKERFIRETFQSQGQQYFGNPQIRRDGSNLEVNPASETTDPSDFIVGSNEGSYYTVNTSGNENINMELNMGRTQRLETIVIQGKGTFKIYCSKVSNTNEEFENNPVYHFNGSTRNDKFVMPTDSDTSIKSWDNLQNSNGGFVFGKFVRIVPVVNEPESQDNENSTDNSFQIKLEVYAVESDSRSREQLHSAPIADYKMYNENGQLVEGGEAWESEDGNTDPFVKIKFIKDDKSRNVLVSKVVLESVGNKGPKLYNIKYQNTHEDKIHTTPPINGCVEGSGTCHYYFKYPVLANTMIIKPISVGGNKKYKIKVRVYGSEITPDEEARAARAIKNITLNEINKNKDSCPSVNELLNKQNTAQRLCDALGYQETIKNNKVKLEKNRLYLRKIKDQKEQISNLEKVVNELNTIKEQRETQDDLHKLAQYEYQKSVDAKLSDLVDQRLQHQKRMKLNVNLVGKGNKN